MSKVISECCQAQVQHYPTTGLPSMEGVIFFCTKCNKECKVKILKEEKDKER